MVFLAIPPTPKGQGLWLIIRVMTNICGVFSVGLLSIWCIPFSSSQKSLKYDVVCTLWGKKLRLVEVRRLAAGEVTSESLASRAWPRQSEFSIEVLNLFRKDSSHLYHKLSREHLTSIFWLPPDKQETEKVVPGSTPDSRGGVLDPSPHMGITFLFLLTLQSGSYGLRIPCFFTLERPASELVLPCFRAGPPRRFHPDCQTPWPQWCWCKRAGSSSWLLAKGKPTNPQKNCFKREKL